MFLPSLYKGDLHRDTRGRGSLQHVQRLPLDGLGRTDGLDQTRAIQKSLALAVASLSRAVRSSTSRRHLRRLGRALAEHSWRIASQHLGTVAIWIGCYR